MIVGKNDPYPFNWHKLSHKKQNSIIIIWAAVVAGVTITVVALFH